MDDFLKQPPVLGTLLALIGLLPLLGATFAWDWLFTNPKLSGLEDDGIGRGPIRIGLAILGILLLAVGIAIGTGLLKQGAFS